MKLSIALIEPFYAGSHKKWCDDLVHHSRHDITLFSLPGRHWKWRMQGSAIPLANHLNESENSFDLIVVTDFLNLSLFKSLLKKELSGIPVIIYFHENQLAYPWSPTDPDPALGRDLAYGFINFSSALVADRVLFNSSYNRSSFLEGLKQLFKKLPDYNDTNSIKSIELKSKVLPLGLNLKYFDRVKKTHPAVSSLPTILWNHRWEYDKNPELFFEALIQLKENNISFNLIVLGAANMQSPNIFNEAKEALKDNILHWGFCKERDEYAKWLCISNILPVTSNQDFFGISVVEAIYTGCIPLLPMRLAYSDHLPSGSSKQFYDTDLEFHTKLEQLCQNWPVEAHQAWPKHVSQYDWSHMIQRYDQAFNGIVSNTQT